MWVAYLVPEEDTYLVAKYGLDNLAKGETQEAAIANLRGMWEQDEAAAMAKAAEEGYENDEPMEFCDGYILHTADLG